MRYLILTLKGMIYGLTHVVPGIGGGIVLIMLGIYQPFVEALGNLALRRDRWHEYLPFLASLGVGMVVAVVLFARAASIATTRHPAVTMFACIGLLLGTVPSVLRMHADMHPSWPRTAALAAGLAAVALIRLTEQAGLRARFLADLGSPAGMAYNLVTAYVGGAASVTPGLDGSYVLLLAGTYGAVMDALGRLASLTISWRVLMPTVVGAVLGIVSCAKGIEVVLRRAPAASAYAVLGLIGGSVIGLWPHNRGDDTVPAMVLAFAAGAVLAVLMGRSSAAPSAQGAP